MDRKRPKQATGTTLDRSNGTGVLRGADGTELCRLNETASALWELCDGETTADEMIDAVCEACGVGREQAAQDIARALSDLADVGAIEWGP